MLQWDVRRAWHTVCLLRVSEDGRGMSRHPDHESRQRFPHWQGAFGSARRTRSTGRKRAGCRFVPFPALLPQRGKGALRAAGATLAAAKAMYWRAIVFDAACCVFGAEAVVLRTPLVRRSMLNAGGIGSIVAGRPEWPAGLLRAAMVDVFGAHRPGAMHLCFVRIRA